MRKVIALLLCLSGLLLAAPKVSQKQLDAWVAHWQRVLQLEDWRIAAMTARIDDLPDGAAGVSRSDPAYQEFTIHVLDPQDYARLATDNGVRPKYGKAILRDIEDTVLHEMLHLRLRSFRVAQEGDMRSAEELVVVRLTSAFLGKR